MLQIYFTITCFEQNVDKVFGQKKLVTVPPLIFDAERDPTFVLIRKFSREGAMRS